jgi:hypothetical protein
MREELWVTVFALSLAWGALIACKALITTRREMRRLFGYKGPQNVRFRQLGVRGHWLGVAGRGTTNILCKCDLLVTPEDLWVKPHGIYQLFWSGDRGAIMRRIPLARIRYVRAARANSLVTIEFADDNGLMQRFEVWPKDVGELMEFLPRNAAVNEPTLLRVAEGSADPDSLLRPDLAGITFSRDTLVRAAADENGEKSGT